MEIEFCDLLASEKRSGVKSIGKNDEELLRLIIEPYLDVGNSENRNEISRNVFENWICAKYKPT